MPIRAYVCNQCKHEFEQLYLSFSEEEREKDNVSCPKCASKDLDKPIGGTSFQLKGSGWYVTDYKKRK